MVYGITAGQVLVASSETWAGVSDSMYWWIRETLHSWGPLSDDVRWNDAVTEAHIEWKHTLHAFSARDRLVRWGVVHPLWESETPGKRADDRLPVRVGTLTQAEAERLPQPGTLALARYDGRIQKVKVVSHHVGTMTSMVRITSNKNMPKGAARRVITVPWAYLSPRP